MADWRGPGGSASGFDFSPEDVKRLRQQIGSAGGAAQRKMAEIRAEYEGIVGREWSGSASVAAAGKQDELNQIWAKQRAILEKVAEDLTVMEGWTMAQEEESERGFKNISAGTGMQTSYVNRL